MPQFTVEDRREWTRDYMRQRREKERESRQPKLCPECGSHFPVRMGNVVYCSPECRLTALKRRRRDEYVPAPLTCIECEAPVPYKSGKRRFCSGECSVLHANRRRRWLIKGLTQEPPAVIACGICGTETSDYHIDHDHSCCSKGDRSCAACFRGFLCRLCNLGIGFFKDDEHRLAAAITYLRAHAR